MTYGAAAYGALEYGGASGSSPEPSSAAVSASLTGQQEHGQAVVQGAVLPFAHVQGLSVPFSGLQQTHAAILDVPLTMPVAFVRDVQVNLNAEHEWMRGLASMLIAQQEHLQRLAALFTLRTDSSAVPLLEYLTLSCSMAATVPLSISLVQQLAVTMTIASSIETRAV